MAERMRTIADIKAEIARLNEEIEADAFNGSMSNGKHIRRDALTEALGAVEVTIARLEAENKCLRDRVSEQGWAADLAAQEHFGRQSRDYR